MQRRDFVKLISGAFAMAFIAPITAFAAIWNKAAFETNKLNEAEKKLEINSEKFSQDILITVPDKAENGAIVQVEVKSNIPNTETISILVEKNPTPLIAHFKFSNGAEPFVVTRIKMAETSNVKVVVKAGNQYFTNAKNVIVLENGCG
ncbi:thiosulfate oxidation carrier protein SoxY [Methylotenera sp.]|uniref:thiosulfate oxidation carrier protein SoxY n=1 Tax=Methylotenera sp. TaxID=2051956 RepID=UPI00248793BC|nr:thiosulfate oxidation carrier protein SoxY [Methylotenera sp.]MDI1298310.1 thiosulfate oxidation carrier protein SoxY [Methylotenera sp.]